MNFENIRSIPNRTGLRLKDTACIVTGAGSGRGKEIAFTFAREGARVAVADLNKEAAKSVADEIFSSGGSAIAVGVDVTNKGQVQSAVYDVVARYCGVDVLVSNAGIQIVHRIENFDDWKKIRRRLPDNAACSPRMQASGLGGSLIYIGSVHSKEASVLKAAYVTSQQARTLGTTANELHDSP
jgi:3-hydroxybutyrate dehydrogenase